MPPLFFLSLLSFFLFVFAVPTEFESRDDGDISTTSCAFTLTAYNSSYPNIDGKELWIHSSGFVYLDAGAANPSLSFKLFAFLENTRLRRVRQLGSSVGTEGNLNFGTSMVCCDYTRLNFSTPADIAQLPTSTTPFYLTGGDRHLVFAENTPFPRPPWYACTEQGGGSGLVVYYNKPFYNYPDHGDSECTAVTLVSKTVQDLPPHDPTPVPTK